MNHFMLILSFIGEWLLFAFPFYQSCLELEEQESSIRLLTKDDSHYRKISSWYWLLPFYKIYYEKRRAVEIIRKEGLHSDKLTDMLRYFDKATAWFYVSIAGLLKGISTTYELFESFHWEEHYTLFVLTVLVLILLSFINVGYRMSKRRKQRMLSKVDAIKEN